MCDVMINILKSYFILVPLEHFLYTGSNGKTRDERFLLLDANGRFLEQGYKKAVQVGLDFHLKPYEIGPKRLIALLVTKCLDFECCCFPIVGTKAIAKS